MSHGGIARSVLVVCALSGCGTKLSEDTSEVDAGYRSGPVGDPNAVGCPAYAADVYTPFSGSGPFPNGTVKELPWRGPTATYPDGVENFRGYAPPVNVECGGTRSRRSYLDVTAGCLDAVASSTGTAGRITGTSDGYYRSFALAFAPGDATHPVQWTDQGIEYRFFYTKQTGNVSNPGFKAFARYVTEYDLYVASWRMDGVVQIQKKQCGEYTILKRDDHYGAPRTNTWHTIRFTAVGRDLRLYLDGTLAMTVADDTFVSGTAGIRIDSADGALIDDWRVFAP